MRGIFSNANNNAQTNGGAFPRPSVNLQLIQTLAQSFQPPYVAPDYFEIDSSFFCFFLQLVELRENIFTLNIYCSNKSQ